MSKPKTAVAKVSQLPALIDEYGQISADIAPKKKRAEVLRAQILAEVGTFDAGTYKILEGQIYSLHISPQQQETEIDGAKLLKKLGVSKFLTVAKVTLTALKAAIAGDEIEQYITVRRTGPRTLSPTRKLIAA